MAGNACWPHRKQELTLHCKTIISQYYIHFSICRKKWGGGALQPPGFGVPVRQRNLIMAPACNNLSKPKNLAVKAPHL